MEYTVKCISCFMVISSAHSFLADGREPDISSGAYLGCFHDIGDYATFMRPSAESNLVPDSCRGRCRNESFIYIGLWGGVNCWCASAIYERSTPNRSDSSGLLEKVDDSQCNASCSGNSSLSCGGFTVENNINVFSVYSVCPVTTYGRHCKSSCNCKDNNHCSLLGVCPNNECAAGWNTSSINNRLVCNTDIDECQRNQTICDQMCNNTDGSYFCSCLSGFSLDEKDKRKCTDIDECAEKTSNCVQNCTNTIGNYTCSCYAGFEYQSDGFNCKDVNECETDAHNCAHVCNNLDGTYSCSCHSGYYLVGNYFCEKDTSIGVAIGFVIFSIIIALSLAANVIQWRRIRQLILLVKNKGDEIVPDAYTTLRNHDSIDAQDPYTSIIAPVKANEKSDVYQNINDSN